MSSETTKTHILIVEDDPFMTKMLVFLLADSGYQTTTLSADLLRLARDGHACLESLGLLAALHRPDIPVTGPIHRFLSIGHTSGADLATGLALGLRMREGR